MIKMIKMIKMISLLLCLSLIQSSTSLAISFQEVTTESGISYSGQSWGAAWGDFNGDGWPDLWTPNHGMHPSLYINNQDGTFTDIASVDILPDDILGFVRGYDAHGAAWADFDNDGDQDLVQLADGGIRKHANELYINAGNGIFERVEQAFNMGIDQPDANARTPLWLDWNNDGLLDLLAANAMRTVGVNPPATLFEQGPSGFVSVQESELNLQEPTAFAMLSDLTGDGRKEILLGASKTAIRVYSNTGAMLTDETVNLGFDQYKRGQDVSLSDLTGDFQTEIHIIRGEVVSGVEQDGCCIIESTLTASKNQKGFSFTAAGQLSVNLYPTFKVLPTDVFIGSTGFSPDSINFTLSPDDPDVVGLPSYIPGEDKGFYIGFDPAINKWTIYLSSSIYADSRNLLVSSDEAIGDLLALNFDNNETPRPDLLLVNQGGVFNEEAVHHGIDLASSGRSIVAADFDNDMDVDVYILASGPVVNLPNIFYENDGMGNFSVVADAWGAAGTLLGRGDTVSTVDFDRDGFLDLFLTNGKSKPPFEHDGPYQLYKNEGNSNYWIELDLEGTVSNRDGIGATVKLTAGGVTQVREQDGGIHRRTQNHQRIHFGLASNKVADSLVIHWPSGTVQTLLNVSSNQIIHIIESEGITNLIDTDRDGIGDNTDSFPTNDAASVDADKDGLPDAWNTNCDVTCQTGSGLVLDTSLDDTDNDGVMNGSDVFPSDPTESADTDRDGIGDNTDAFPQNIAASVDADKDGLPDAWNASCDVICQSNSGLTLDPAISVASSSGGGGTGALSLLVLGLFSLLGLVRRQKV